MTCKCNEKRLRDHPHPHDDNHRTRPDEVCYYCAEKHLSTAATLAKEQGYAGINRGYIIGELVAASWHLYGGGKAAAELSAALREFRHRIQSRREDETLTDFSPYLLAIDAIIRADMAASESES